ncbi:MAG: GlsB/YeaQ/YmgE family stress response membrane protein [Candidatus Omnitrophota bacterium]
MENSTVTYWVWFLFIGGVIGWLAGLIIRGRGFGIIGDIVVGIVGAMLGGWIARGMGLYTSSSIGAFLVALAGALVLVGLTRLVVRQVAV